LVQRTISLPPPPPGGPGFLFIFFAGTLWNKGCDVGGGGGPHVLCQLKFHYFVGCHLKFLIFVDCR